MADKFIVWRRNDGIIGASAGYMPRDYTTGGDYRTSKGSGKPVTFIMLGEYTDWNLAHTLAMKECENNNCQGSEPHTAGEVKVMPAGGDSNMILCCACWHKELDYREDRNRELADFAKFDLPAWNDAKVYED